MSDFSGLATVYGIVCNDGRVIRQGAFDHQNGQTIPLVWRHGHNDMRNVVGHGVLSVNAEPPGIRIHGKFNNTKEGTRAKQLVDSKDVSNLSIWANEIVEHALAVADGNDRREVERGTIREVSLVLAGANPGAKIDDFVRHSDDPFDADQIIMDGVIVHSGISIDLEEETEEEEDPDDESVVEHEDGDEGTEEDTIEDVLATLNDSQQNLFNIILHAAAKGETTPPTANAGENGDGPTVQEVYDTLSERQINVLNYMAAELSQEDLSQGDENLMTTNIFEQPDDQEDNVLSHESVTAALAFARDGRVGSLREVFIAQDIHISHSITDIDYLFPDAKTVSPGGPEFYTRPMEWVEKVLGPTNTRPFSRIKSWYADLTPDAARAKGYVTAAQKAEEVIAVLKRVTTPQTIYKLQKLDRDDILDITDFDVVVWLKSEMRLMLREELARAVLFSDGRANTGADAIQTANVRPIYSDDAVYTVQHTYNDIGNEQDLSAFTDAETIDLVDFIGEYVDAYRGSGSPVFYCQPAVYTKLMHVRDGDGRRLHQSKSALAAALEVSDIVTIPVAAGMEDTGEVDPAELPAGTYDIARLGVIVNLRDYVIGMDRGGQTSFFDDFDLDYNKYTYLYETRLSGALIHPKSAVAVNLVTAKTA